MNNKEKTETTAASGCTAFSGLIENNYSVEELLARSQHLVDELEKEWRMFRRKMEGRNV